MNIIEVKNNLVKLSYEEDITISSFIKIVDISNTYIAQILHLESSRIGKIAVARLIFNYRGTIQAYDGSVPSIQSDIEILDDDFFLNTLDSTDPLVMGKLTHKNNNVTVSAKLLKDKPVICAEKAYQYSLLVENILKQNEENGRKTVVIDITGDIRGNKITATKDFKMPLNQYSIDYIFERGFEDATPENKAFIQDIFSELNEYIKTVDYIPFNDFNAVIDYEFKRTQLLQLIMLKNRLVEFEKKGIFAHKEEDFRVLETKLRNCNTLVIDISTLSDTLQAEYIKYVYSVMDKQNSNFYSIVSLNNNNSSKATLNTLFGAKNIFTSVVCPYSYKYMNELKQCSKNMFMFTPIKQQSDFGVYNIFVNKIAEDEYVLYGKATKFIPLILKLEEVTEFPKVQEYEEIKIDEVLAPQAQETSKAVVDNTEIIPSITAGGVSNILTGISSEESNVEVSETPEVLSEDFSEINIIENEELTEAKNTETEDINVEEKETSISDFSDINISQSQSTEGLSMDVPREEDVAEELELSSEEQTSEADIMESVEDSVETIVEEETTEESESIPEVNKLDDNTIENTDFKDINLADDVVETSEAPEVENVEIDLSVEEAPVENRSVKKEIEVKDQMEGINFDIDIADDEIATVLSKIESNIQEDEIDSPVAEEYSEEDDLTDDDLDMIDSLQAEQPIEESVDLSEKKNDLEIYDNEQKIEITESSDESEETGSSEFQELLNEAEELDSTDDIEIIEDINKEDHPQEETLVEPQRQMSITDEILMEDAQRKAEEEANAVDPIEEQIEKRTVQQKEPALETKESTTPIVPVYSAEIPDEDIVESDPLQQGDTVVHGEFGKGVIEKIINYGERELYSINFEEVGRKLLDPKISELKKV